MISARNVSAGGEVNHSFVGVLRLAGRQLALWVVLLSWLSIGSAPAWAQTTFTTSCYGNTTVYDPPCGSSYFNALGATASITFPGTVPLDGSVFSSPATLTV